jgi:hypothetical protein
VLLTAMILFTLLGLALGRGRDGDHSISRATSAGQLTYKADGVHFVLPTRRRAGVLSPLQKQLLSRPVMSVSSERLALPDVTMRPYSEQNDPCAVGSSGRK